jgi:hypothetical protein
VVAVDLPFPIPPVGGIPRQQQTEPLRPGPKPGSRGGKIPIPQRIAIQQRLLAGESPRVIAAEYRVSRQAIYLISYEGGLRRQRQAGAASALGSG